MNLPFSDYVAGAVLATDLANTSPVVRHTTGEALPDPAALERFLVEHGAGGGILAHTGRPSRNDLEQVHALRREVRAALQADEEELVERANTLITGAGAGPLLRRDRDGRWQWCAVVPAGVPLAGQLAALAGVGMLGALRALGHERFRRCASPDCEGTFVDVSRAGRRRYCMPNLCGNRLNVANHRARRAGRPPA